MATYAIGDLQGCLAPLQRLLEEVRFDPNQDRLWFTGDLVNRGPASLEVLRFVKSLGQTAVTVLGNHDLHLLMVARGVERMHRQDTLQPVLRAPDREELLDWLRRRPLIHAEGKTVLVHAGLLPQWSIPQALALGREVERALVEDLDGLCRHLYGNQPDRWDERLTGYDRLRVVVNAMTRLRVVTRDGRMEFSHKGTPEEAPSGCVPWYAVPERRSRDHFIVCGHWAAQGLRLTEHLAALDTGCVWGGKLTAFRLEDRRVFQVPCGESAGAGRSRSPAPRHGRDRSE
ncbi:symmetrical bis(5'-nucleosyl)-tetraphosphatase [Pelomicrobium methylotrophicum]|uniref:Bis(5'-nucleosyl)-tetraphosphatase, symmetrical n=1 Tax=Pelomicrobium methylotrophicum TaxID=2602750 RepID=A0A5C7EUS5_9PROT|nr:symmetrical bis(5'-nucleosyl)-tetraphosphatase [Pelomicrobium methylotrophicum]TXF12547.1 symmetrical bis(5'-nucleosyl)-tetraphosphatase [Pelomicrobium methylotrophicum]